MDLYQQETACTLKSRTSLLLLLGWGTLVGLVYSTVGAAGGILASVGLISVFGLQNPNLVKPMAQALTLVTPLIAVPLYVRQCRVVYVLAALFGVGGILGAFIGSSLSSVWLSDMSLFKSVFAILVLFIAGQIAWQLLRSSPETDELSHAIRAADAFGQHVKSGGQACDIGVTHSHLSMSKVDIEFGKEIFSFHPLLPFFAGMGIAVLSSALGVGGGFLLVPFMSIIMQLPMHVIACTSARNHTAFDHIRHQLCTSWSGAGLCFAGHSGYWRSRRLIDRAIAQSQGTGKRIARFSRYSTVPDWITLYRCVMSYHLI